MPELSESDLKHLTHGELINLVNRGMLRVMTSAQTLTLNMQKDSLPEYIKFRHLKGVAISIGNASRKYNIPHPTISRWVKRGLVEQLGMDKNRVLIDEADIAYCAEISSHRPGRGKWLFNPDGSPYIPENPK